MNEPAQDDLTLTGSVFRGLDKKEKSQSLVQGAVVKLQINDSDLLVKTADENGRFKFTKEELEGYKNKTCSLIAFNEHDISRKVNLTLSISQDVDVFMIPKGNLMHGKCWFSVFGLMLAFLVYCYYDKHEQVGTTEDNVNTIVTIQNTFKSLILPSTEEDINQNQINILDIENKLVTINDSRIGLSQKTKEEMNELFKLATIPLNSNKNIRNKEIESFQLLKTEINALFLENPNNYFWLNWPWLLVELWCWGLLAVLIQKLVVIGWYLRSWSYYPEGLWMHLSHILTTPILGVITVLFLSLANIQVGSQISINLNSPIVMIVVVFLLCIYPWKLWDYVKSQSDKIGK